MKKLFSILLLVALAVGLCMPIAYAAPAAPMLSTMTLRLDTFAVQNIVIQNRSDYHYSYTISNNLDKKGNPYVRAISGIGSNPKNDTQAVLPLVGLRVTSSVRPVVSIYYQDGVGKKLLGKVTVSVCKNSIQVKLPTLTIGYNCVEQITFRYPYGSYPEGFTFRIEDTKIARQTSPSDLAPESTPVTAKTAYLQNLTFQGLKKGSTTVRAYISGIYVGKFTMKVVDKKAVLKQSAATLYFYKNGSIDKSVLNIINTQDSGLYGLIRYHNTKATYSLQSSNPAVVDVSTTAALAQSPGKATVTVYETLNNKTRKVGTLNITVRTGKMSDIAAFNASTYDDGVFTSEGSVEIHFYQLIPYRFEDEIKSRLLNNDRASRSHFADNEYSICYLSSNPNVIKILDGVASPIGEGTADVFFTITFIDGSVYSSKCSFQVMK